MSPIRRLPNERSRDGSLSLRFRCLHEDATLLFCRGRDGTRTARVFSHVSTQNDWNKSVMTIHVAEGPTGVAVRRSLARWNLEVHSGPPPIRYGFSVVCVVVALGAALASRYYGVRDVELPLFELAIVVTTWYAGV